MTNNSQMTAQGICANLCDPESDIRAIADAINDAVKSERRRCFDIVAAEVEWGGDICEARDMIKRGDDPRIIPGWNAPDEDDEDEYLTIDDFDEMLQATMDRDRE